MKLFRDDMTELQLGILFELYTNPFTPDVDIANKVYGDASNIKYTLTKLGAYRPTRLKTFYALGYINMPEVMPTVRNRMVNNILRAMHVNPCGTTREYAELTGYTYHSTVVSVRKVYNYFKMPLHASRQHRTRLGFYAHMGWFDAERLAHDAMIQYDVIMEARNAHAIS